MWSLGDLPDRQPAIQHPDYFLSLKEQPDKRQHGLSSQACLRWPAQPLCHRSYTFGKLQLSVPWQGLNTGVIKNYKEQRNITGGQQKSRDDNSWSLRLDLGALCAEVEGIVAPGENVWYFISFCRSALQNCRIHDTLPRYVAGPYISVFRLQPCLLTSGRASSWCCRPG